ncbi:hypothetical protein FB451DRAFT_1128215 [Mycena latifolia]|nr:hypothetical protein FB451DRAFT_1128215 [Mycena latifolia]
MFDSLLAISNSSQTFNGLRSSRIVTVVCNFPGISDHTIIFYAGKACFVVEPDDPDYRGNLKPTDSIECTKCDPPVPLSLKNKQTILQHNAGHILFDPTIRRSDQPCGLCLRPFPMCTFYLTTGQGTDSARQVDWKRSTCLRRLPFSMAAAMRWSAQSPCTNYLIPCPLQCGLAIWTYNIEAHYRSTRHGLKSLGNVVIPYKMAPLEESSIRLLHNNRQTYQKPRRLKGNAARPPLATSDAHSSRLALRVTKAEDPRSISDDEATDEEFITRGRRRARRFLADSDSESTGEHNANDPTDEARVKLERFEDSEEPDYLGAPEINYSLPAVADDDVDREIDFFAAPGMDFACRLNGPRESTPTPPISASGTTDTSAMVTPFPAAGPSAATLPLPPALPTVPVQAAQPAQTHSSRPQRNKRKKLEGDAINCCYCGSVVSDEEKNDTGSTIQCIKAECGTWYHTEHVEISGGRNSWVCMSCGGGKRRRT